MEDIKRVFDELNGPSASKLLSALRAEGLRVKRGEVDAFVARQSVRQVQAPRYKFDGKIAADGINDRWFADLIDFTAAPTDGGKSVGLHPAERFKYILAVQDVFSRFLYTQPLVTKTPKEVAAAFNRILERSGGKPHSVTTDQGSEFSGPFLSVLEKEGIMAQQKAPIDINAIATLDTAIGNFKKALARDCRSAGTSDWAARLEKVTAGQNKLPNDDYLEGVAPAKVKDAPELIAHLRQKNASFHQFNSDRIVQRQQALQAHGRFRSMIASGKYTRSFKPRWSDQLHGVKSFEGAEVTDSTGKTHLTKFTQPVPEGTTEDAGATTIEQKRSVQTEEKIRAVLQPWAEKVLELLKGTKGEMPLGTLGQKLNPQGFLDAGRRAGINMKSPLANFLRAFPEHFQMITSAKGGDSRVRLVAGGT